MQIGFLLLKKEMWIRILLFVLLRYYRNLYYITEFLISFESYFEWKFNSYNVLFIAEKSCVFFDNGFRNLSS